MSLIQTNPISKQDNRQEPLLAEVRFDFTAGGLVVGANPSPGVFTIPAGGRVIGGGLVVDVAWVGPTACNIDLGDGDGATRYLANVNLLAAGYTALTIDGHRYAATDGIDINIDSTVAAPTAGQAHIILMYMVEDRSESIQE